MQEIPFNLPSLLWHFHTPLLSNFVALLAHDAPVIVSSKHTFDIKSRKYLTARLKDNLGKAMKKVRLTVTVNGMTYSAKTDNRGYADFLVNMVRKGTYKATFTYYGNDFYKSVSKSITVSVK